MMTIRNLYRDGDVLVAVREDGQRVEVGEAVRTFYARPHPALDAIEYDEAPGGWLRVVQRFRSGQLGEVVGRWRSRGVELMEADVKPVDRALADLDLRISSRLSYAFIDLECAEPPIEALRAREYKRFEIVSFAYRTSDGKRGCVLVENRTPAAERVLLKKLAQVFRSYDVVLAWNGGREWGDGQRREDGFDFPVIRARCKALDVDAIDWWRCMCIDQMDLYKLKFLQTTDGGQRASLGLSAVAKANGLAGKVDLKQRLRERGIEPGQVGITAAYEHAPDLLREYNLGDVDAQWEIEQKTGYLALHLATCRLVTMLPRSDSLTPTRTMDALMLRLGHRSGHHWPTRMREYDDTSEKIRGAVVRQGQPGFYRDLAVLDVSSLYPSLIRALNLGSDTKRDDGSIAPIMSDENGRPTDAVIARFAGHDEPGQIPRALEIMLSKRAEFDVKMQSLDVGTPEHDDLKRLSNACKVAANSFYGLMLQPGSRFYDADVGAAVTSTGRLAINAIGELLESRGYKIRIQDTDSAGFECEDPEAPARLAEEINSRLFPDLFATMGVPREVSARLLKIKHEETYRRMLIVRTKGYAGFFSVYKGQPVPVDREVLDLKGLEAVKGSTILRARELQRETILRVLRGESSGEVRAFAERELARFAAEDLALVDLIAHTKITKDLDEYKSQTPHVRVAAEYVALGREFEGSKVAYWFARGERPKMTDDWDLALVDRTWYWDKHVWPPTQRVLEAAWPGQEWDMSTGPKQISLFDMRPSESRPTVARQAKRRRVAEEPAEVFVRLALPPLGERSSATKIRDKIRISKVKQVALENPGSATLVLVFAVGDQYETRLETPIMVDPNAQAKLEAAGIIQASKPFEEDNDGSPSSSGRARA